MIVERHPHGTSARYAHGPAGDGVDPCRCTPCREAHNASARRRYRLHAYQRPTMVDAEPVRAHVHALAAAGLGAGRVERLAGVSRNVMQRLLYGRPSTGSPPSLKITADNAAAILAVQATPDVLAPGASVPAHGTRRRLQALVARGWGLAELSRRLGWHRGHLFRVVHGHDGVTAATARTVTALYEQLWDQPPPQATKAQRNAFSRALRLARQHQWVVPMQWDDHDLDREDALPGGRSRRGTRDVQLEEDVTRLLAEDVSVADIARRLGRNQRVVYKVRDRIRRENGEAA